MTTEANYEHRFAEAAKTMTEADCVRHKDYVHRLLSVGLITDTERDKIITRHNKYMAKYCDKRTDGARAGV